MQTRAIRPTMAMGMSRAVRGRDALPPLDDCDDAEAAATRPRHTGMTSLPSVQIDEMAMVPAPISLTLVLNAALAAAARSPGTGCWVMKYGTKKPQALVLPTAMEMPTVRPIKWPAPPSASEKPPPMPVPALGPPFQNLLKPSEKNLAPMPSGKMAETAEPATMVFRPVEPVSTAVPSAAAPWSVPEPTFNTSAAATPSG